MLIQEVNTYFKGSHFKRRYSFATEETFNSSLIKFQSKLISDTSLIKLKFLK